MKITKENFQIKYDGKEITQKVIHRYIMGNAVFSAKYYAVINGRGNKAAQVIYENIPLITAEQVLLLYNNGINCIYIGEKTYSLTF